MKKYGDEYKNPTAFNKSSIRVNIIGDTEYDRHCYVQLLDWLDEPTEETYAVYSGKVYKFDLELKDGSIYTRKREVRRSPLGKRIRPVGKLMTREEVIDVILNIRSNQVS